MQSLRAGQIQSVSQTCDFPKHFFSTPGTHLLQSLPSGVEIFRKSKVVNNYALSSEFHGMGGIFGGAQRLGLALSKVVSKRFAL